MFTAMQYKKYYIIEIIKTVNRFWPPVCGAHLSNMAEPVSRQNIADKNID